MLPLERLPQVSRVMLDFLRAVAEGRVARTRRAGGTPMRSLIRRLFERARGASDWGTFRCDSIACGHLPRLGVRLYWSSPTLIVTRPHVPLLSRVCDPVSARPRTWDCRNGFVDRGAVNASSREDVLLGWNDEGEVGW